MSDMNYCENCDKFFNAPHTCISLSVIDQLKLQRSINIAVKSLADIEHQLDYEIETRFDRIEKTHFDFVISVIEEMKACARKALAEIDLMKPEEKS